MPRLLRSATVDPNVGGTYLAQTRFVVVQELALPLPGDPTPKPPAPEGWALMELAAALEAATHARVRELMAHTPTVVSALALAEDRLHLVLRTRPAVAQRWSDEQLLDHWLALHPKRGRLRAPVPTPPAERAEQLADAAELGRRRQRLGDLSYFLKSLKQDLTQRLEPTGKRVPLKLRWAGVVRTRAVSGLPAARRQLPAVKLGPVLPAS